MTALAVQLPPLHTGMPIILQLQDGTRGPDDLNDLIVPLLHLPAPRKPVAQTVHGVGWRHIWLNQDRIRSGTVYEWPTACGPTGILFVYCALFHNVDLCPLCFG